MCLGNRNCRRGFHIIKINSGYGSFGWSVNEYGGVKCQLLLMYWKIIAVTAADRPSLLTQMRKRADERKWHVAVVFEKFENCIRTGFRLEMSMDERETCLLLLHEN